MKGFKEYKNESKGKNPGQAKKTGQSMSDFWWTKWHWDRFPPPRVLRFSPVNFIPPVIYYTEKWKKLVIIIFITGLHNKP
jgi:hypothetical protein